MIVIVLALLSACRGDEVAHEHTYTCPMHPTVISDRPGACPVCGMDLVQTHTGDTNAEIVADLAPLLTSPAISIVSGLKTIKGEYKSVPTSVDVAGVVAYDTRHLYTIPARVGGRIERVFVRAEFQPISRGQKIAEIYSPELVAAQRELIHLLANDADNKGLIDGARQKLLLLGMTKQQITSLAQSLKPATTIPVYSEYSGYVVRSGVATSEDAPLLREGHYVERGETLFAVVADQALRIDLSVPASYAPLVERGTPVEVITGAGNVMDARVELVKSFFEKGEHFAQMRVHANEWKEIRIGELVTARLQLDSTEGLWVPRAAVLSLGLQDVVFLQDRGLYKPKRVTTGVSANGEIRIESGLASTDEIAANAQFLVDSDSFIKPVQ